MLSQIIFMHINKLALQIYLKYHVLQIEMCMGWFETMDLVYGTNLVVSFTAVTWPVG